VSGTPLVNEVLPVEAVSVPRARWLIREAARGVGMAERMVVDLSLAVTEVCSNVVMHAYRRSPPSDAVFEVAAWLIDDELYVTVRDHGIGPSARLDSPGLGLGLRLIAQLARSVEIRREDGTVVRMRFPLS
jgi:anti-sigma regulatory factor (Ser/Thr protein kinase)